MKKLTLSSVLLCTASVFSAQAFEDISHAELQLSPDYNAEQRSFYYPKRPNQYGSLDYIFISATNGTQFCEEEGYRDAIGGSIVCGEDESSYVEYNWNLQQWRSKGTGSKNQCYPVYRTLTCGRRIPELP